MKKLTILLASVAMAFTLSTAAKAGVARQGCSGCSIGVINKHTAALKTPCAAPALILSDKVGKTQACPSSAGWLVLLLRLF